MKRLLLAAALIIATVSAASAFHRDLHFHRAQPAFPKAKNGVVTLYYMPGGVVAHHIIQSLKWLKNGYRVVIADDQYSAAAMMVVHFKSKGGKVCAKKGADLYFHLMSNNQHPSVVIGNRKTIGPLTHRFKRISPAAFGIPHCK